MRRLALLCVLAACPDGASSDCKTDEHCAGAAVCARTSECLPATEVRTVRVTWTIRGAPASDMSCAGAPDLYLLFAGTDIRDTFGYAPVPCRAGAFTVDKLPRRYVSAEIGVEDRFSETAAIDANGNVAFDLFP